MDTITFTAASHGRTLGETATQAAAVRELLDDPSIVSVEIHAAIDGKRHLHVTTSASPLEQLLCGAESTHTVTVGGVVTTWAREGDESHPFDFFRNLEPVEA